MTTPLLLSDTTGTIRKGGSQEHMGINLADMIRGAVMRTKSGQSY